MRNLKRALSLALASIMVLGLMVVGSAAESYTDVTAEHNVEAIDVLQSVDPAVMEGVGEGKFEPETELTRGMMAVIMCRLLDYTVGSYKGTSPFTDVPAGHWAEEFVAACYTNKITAGVSATEYGVDEKVTTGQAGLMILKALGYFQEPGDFGADWLVETVRVGSQAGLFEGIKNGARDALTRNDAAQMCLNALETEMVEIGSHDLSTGLNGQLTTKAVYIPRTGSSTEAKYNSINNKTDGTNRTIELGEFLYNGDLKKQGTSDDFGRPSNTWKYKSKEIGTYANGATYAYNNKVSKGTLYGDVGKIVIDAIGDGSTSAYTLTVYLDGEAVTNVTTAGAVTDKWGGGNESLVNTKAALFGTTTNSSAHITYYGTAVDPNTGAHVTSNLTGNGVKTEVYVDDDAKTVTVCVIKTYMMRATGDYDSSNKNLNVEILTGPATSSKLELDDIPNLAEFAEDDYMMYTVGYNGSGYDVITVEKPMVITGEVESLTKNSVTLDGKKYSYAKTFEDETGNTDAGQDTGLTRFTVGETAAILAMQCGDEDSVYLMWVDDSTFSTGSYVYINNADDGVLSRTATAAAYHPDGVYEEITVKKVRTWGGSSYTDVTGSTNIKTALTGSGRGWYSFTKDASNQYTLTAAKTSVVTDYTSDKGDGVALIGEAVQFMGRIKSDGTTAPEGRANARTTFIVDDGSDVNVYTGADNSPNVKAVTKADGNPGTVTVGYIKHNDKATEPYASLVFVDASEGDVIETTSSDELMYILKTDRTYKDSKDTVNVYHVVRDGKLVTDVEAIDNLGAGTMWHKIRTDSNGRVTDNSTPFPTNTAGDKYYQNPLTNSAVVAKNDSVSFTDPATGDDFILTSDSKITLIAMKSSGLAKDGADYEIFSGANVLNSKLKGYTVTNGHYYVVATENNSKVVDAMYVVVSGVTTAAVINNDARIASVAAATAGGGSNYNAKAAIVGDTIVVSLNDIKNNGGGLKEIQNDQTIVLTPTLSDTTNASVSPSTITLTYDSSTSVWSDESSAGPFVVTAADGTTKSYAVVPPVAKVGTLSAISGTPTSVLTVGAVSGTLTISAPEAVAFGETETSANAVKYQWKANDGKGGTSFSNCSAGNHDTSSFTLNTTDFATSGTYKIKCTVSVVGADPASVDSAEVTVTVKSTNPATPTARAATADDEEVTLTLGGNWTQGIYKLYNSSKTLVATKNQNTDATTLVFTVSEDLVAGTGVTYTMTFTDATGGVESDSITVAIQGSEVAAS